jgi:hypothetical protein
MSMKYSNDTVGNLSRDLPVCSALVQPLRTTAPPGASLNWNQKIKLSCVTSSQTFEKFFRTNMIIVLYTGVTGKILATICRPKIEKKIGDTF